MVEIKKFVEALVATGTMDKSKATDKIKAVIAKIKSEKGDVPDAEIESLINFAITKIAQRKGERYKGICIGYAAKFDQNKTYGEDTLRYFNDGKTKAKVSSPEGLTIDKVTYGVELKDVDGVEVAIPLDMREFIDVAGKIKNSNYNKPLRSYNKRKCYFIVDGELAIVTGNLDPIAGAEYYIYGRKSESKGNVYINVGRSGIQKAGSLTAVELWDAIYKFAESSDFAMPLEDVATLPKNAVKLTTGFIKNGGDTKTGGRWVVINNDINQQGQFGFSANEDAAAALSETLAGNEVFALVQGMTPDPTRESTAIRVLSVIMNPESSANASLIGDIEVFFEGD